MTTTTAAMVHAPGAAFELIDVELTPPRPDEVVVRMVATGVCHTDISAARGTIPFPLPGVLGHEGAGVVEEIGAEVRRVKTGDSVLMTFTSCGHCATCRSGHPAYCDDHLRLNLLGGRRADGSATLSAHGQDLNAHFFGQSSFSRLALADERSLVRLPPGTSQEELVSLSPLGCGLMTGAGAVLNELRPAPGQVLVVTGAGAVGLAAVMASRMTAVSHVIVADRVPSRLALATALGANLVVDTSRTDLRQAVLEATSGRGTDLALETTGSTAVLESLMASLAVRGECVVVGAPAAGSRASFDVNTWLPGRAVRGVTMGDSEPETFIPLLVQAFREGRFPIDRLQRTYAFADIAQAVSDATDGSTIKPVLTFP